MKTAFGYICCGLLMVSIGIGCNGKSDDNIGSQNEGITGDGDHDGPTDCSNINSDKTLCEKPNAVKGKTCISMGNKCVEKTAQLTAFLAADIKFEALMTATPAEIIGSDHGETPDWAKLCGSSTPNWPGMKFEVSKFTLSFKKSSTVARVILDCVKTGQKTFDFPYSIITLPDAKGLLINLDLNGQSVVSTNTSFGNINHNWLEFFTKTGWFYSTEGLYKNTILGTSLLANIGYNYPTRALNSYDDILEAVTFAKGSWGNAGNVGGKDVGAITFIMKKI